MNTMYNLTFDITNLMIELDHDVMAAVYLSLLHAKDTLGCDIAIDYCNIREYINEQQFIIRKSKSQWLLHI